MKLYGIANCSTVKKARDWLKEHDISVEFHDFKKQGLSVEVAQNWMQQTEWERLVNRNGLTWRGLDEFRKQQVSDKTSALALMLEKHSVIKRPLLELDGKLLHVGFDTDAYTRIFKL